MGTLRIAFDEDGATLSEGNESAVMFLEMAMLGCYTPEGYGLTMTTLTPDALKSLESVERGIVVLPPFDELLREVIEKEAAAD